ncbi:hypothetical protein SELMODRAFT_105515, partial [Selaginella moellendorffii]
CVLQMSLILLDYEKAYNRVDWEFLQNMMRKIGILNKFVRWIATLYQHALRKVGNTNNQ